ncbi:MAG: four helix bundle protein [Clostridium sp.]|nr:four helix bundle protein [Clostridium sp.]
MDVKSIKSEEFAVDIITLYKFLTEIKREYVISKQLLRSGTSIGANIAEANFAESIDDFSHKLSISQKECSETLYWLRLLHRTQIIEEQQYIQYETKAKELLKIISSIIVSIKKEKMIQLA